MMDDWLAVLIHSNNVVKRNHYPIRWTENKTLVPTKTLVKMANMLPEYLSGFSAVRGGDAFWVFRFSNL
jgi:hypothetical protein